VKKYHHSRLGLLLKDWNPNLLYAAAPFPLLRIGTGAGKVLIA
jgi:hypothetical protein